MIFDACTHPTLDGTWLGGTTGQTFDQLRTLSIAGKVLGLCAIGLPNVGGYEHDKFFQASMDHGFFPVAALTKLDPIGIGKELDTICDLGFTAVKVHPRLLGGNRAIEMLPFIMQQIYAHGLTCFLCTYYHDKPGKLPETDPYWIIAKGLNMTPDVKLVLMHGGVSRLIEYSQFCRHSNSILLDMSFTMMKYIDTSLSTDISFLLSDLDQRLCIGSDGPEWSYDQVLPRVANLIRDLPQEKRANVVSNNIRRLLGIIT